jgi:ribosomal protein S18 acetylase RimI-like enzyme
MRRTRTTPSWKATRLADAEAVSGEQRKVRAEEEAEEEEAETEFDEAELAEIEAAVKATEGRSVTVELNEEQRRRSLRLAMRYGVRGNKPSTAQIANGADPRGQLDLSFAARAMCDGHATLNNEMKQHFQPLQEELFRVTTRMLYLEGDAIGTMGRVKFEAPSRGQTKAKNRQMRRMLARIEPHLYAIWEITDGDEDSLEGFENLLACLIERGMPGSGALWAQRWVTRNIIPKLHAGPRTRARLEIERTKHKLWAPSAFNTAERIGHVGAAQWRATSPFMGRQRHGTNVLLASRREGTALGKLWTPLGTIVEAPEELEAGVDIDAEEQRLALARAQKMLERSRREREDLRYKASKLLDELKSNGEATEGGEAMEEDTALSAWDSKGIELLYAHQDKEKLPLQRERKKKAKEAWTLGAEDGTVFAEATVHHLLLTNPDDKLVAFIKVLVTRHEAFVDELHVSHQGRGQNLSYRLLEAAVTQLQLPPELQMRLQVEIANTYAVSSYSGSGMKVWGWIGEDGEWHAPDPDGVWTEEDAPDDASMQMMAASAGTVMERAGAKAARTPLAIGLRYLHFIDGAAVERAPEVDWVAKVEAERSAERERRGPRTEAERLALSCGTLNLVDPLARQIIARSIWNVPLPGSAAASVGFGLSADAGRIKYVDSRFRQVTLVMLMLRCWGVKGDGERSGGWRMCSTACRTRSRATMRSCCARGLAMIMRRTC